MDLAGGFEPGGGVVECFGVGTGCKAQLVLGLGTVKGVIALQVVDRKFGQHGLCVPSFRSL